MSRLESISIPLAAAREVNDVNEVLDIVVSELMKKSHPAAMAIAQPVFSYVADYSKSTYAYTFYA